MSQSHVSPSEVRGKRFLKIFGPDEDSKIVQPAFPGARWSEPEECWVVNVGILAHNRAAAIVANTYKFGRTFGASFEVE